ncbi:MAG: hypothetical protein H7315_01835 [Herminiimonas sp.]|nr:hypothetical protein [Herminiimonas sp.]
MDNKEIKVVSLGFLRSQNIELTDKRVELLQAQDKTVVFGVERSIHQNTFLGWT